MKVLFPRSPSFTLIGAPNWKTMSCTQGRGIIPEQLASASRCFRFDSCAGWSAPDRAPEHLESKPFPDHTENEVAKIRELTAGHNANETEWGRSDMEYRCHGGGQQIIVKSTMRLRPSINSMDCRGYRSV